MSDLAVGTQPVERIGRIAFLSVLFMCTVSTVIVFPIIGDDLRSPDLRNNSVMLLLGWLSAAHVAVTSFYYADRDFIPHVRARKARYIYAPAATIAATIGIWGITKDTPYFWPFWQAYHAWLLWHYMRQNIGVSALAATATRAARIGDADRRAISLVGIGGILGAVRFGPAGVVETSVTDALFYLGLAVYLAGLGFGLFQLAKRVAAGKGEAIASAFILASLLFFAPTFIGKTYWPAVMSYAIAHALQYWVLMSLIAIGSGRKSGWIRSIGSLAVMVTALWFVIDFSRNGEMWGAWAGWIAGIGYGITMAHFVIDADSWRMREAFQRSYVLARLGRYVNPS